MVPSKNILSHVAWSWKNLWNLKPHLSRIWFAFHCIEPYQTSITNIFSGARLILSVEISVLLHCFSTLEYSRRWYVLSWCSTRSRISVRQILDAWRLRWQRQRCLDSWPAEVNLDRNSHSREPRLLDLCTWQSKLQFSLRHWQLWGLISVGAHATSLVPRSLLSTFSFAIWKIPDDAK